jgi:hypothetical protein
MTLGLIVLVVAVLVVLATSLLKNVAWSHKTKVLLATVLSVVGAAVAFLVQNGWSVAVLASLDPFAVALSVYGLANLFYNFILKGTEVEATLANAKVLPTKKRKQQ